MSNRHLIERYHDLLAAADPVAEWEQLREGMERRGLRFRERYACNVLRPLLLRRERFAAVERASHTFFGALYTLYEWLLEDDALRARVGLSEVEEAALKVDPGYSSPVGIGRLDAFLDEEGALQFVEYNADSPGGLAFGEALADLFDALPTMQHFARHHPSTAVRPIRDILDTLLAHYREWGGQKARPLIAIVDWEGVGTSGEFKLCHDVFEAEGYETIITHPDALEVRAGLLRERVSGQQVDIVYKRVLVGELLERLGLDNVLTEALRARAACMVNPYRCQLLFQKALFALLSERADHPRFSAAQQHAIHAHLPWTRLVEEGHTGYHGRQVDLVAHLQANQRDLVLKPNSEYGGAGVRLGWECTPEAWAETLQTALESEEPWVVQERIVVRTEPFPLIREGALQLEERFMDLDPYIFAPGDVRGAGVRLGSSGLLNVTAGGGSAAPLFLVDG